MTATATEIFEENRKLLFSVAYRMLGSVADAEDAVQDSWLRWSNADVDSVAHPKAYLVRVVVNTALDKLNSAQRRRESYVGPWLPEPIQTGPDAAEQAETAESVSLAMLVILESLSPDERAVFVLREVFGFPHADIAAALGRTQESVRQLAHRARSHVQARRPRFPADRDTQRQVTETFMTAVQDGDVARLMNVLAPDVALWTDGGGKVRAALNVIHGADKAARFLAAIIRDPWQGVRPEDIAYRECDVNGVPGVAAWHTGGLLGLISVDVADDRINAVHIVVNPDKLQAWKEGRRLE
ncbi:MAG: RNA polymerase sigma-70 factor [Stackebrandtia sp.]